MKVQGRFDNGRIDRWAHDARTRPWWKKVSEAGIDTLTGASAHGYWRMTWMHTCAYPLAAGHGVFAGSVEEGEAGRQLDAQEVRRGSLPWRLESVTRKVVGGLAGVRSNQTSDDLVLMMIAWVEQPCTKPGALRS